MGGKTANVKIAEENRIVTINVTSDFKPKLTEQLIKKWQNILDVLADVLSVPAALIMSLGKDEIKVFLSSATEGNPYQCGDGEKLGLGLYCETVVGKNKMLSVENALDSPVWDHNPDIKLDMISYLGMPIYWPDQEVFGTICVLDSKARKYNEKYIKIIETFRDAIENDFKALIRNNEIKESYHFFETLFEAIPSGLMILDHEEKIIEYNQSAQNINGINKEDVLGKNIYDVFSHSCNKIYDVLSACQGEGSLKSVELDININEEKTKTILLNAACVKDGENRHKNIIMSFNDITYLKELESDLKDKNQHLKNLSMKDGLTGLYNHITIHDFLDNEIKKVKRNQQNQVSIGMFDIDFFKNVNDTYGHKKGDYILKELANVIRSEIRSIDIAGRYGGEEFLVIFTSTNLQQAYEVCERIRKKVETYHFQNIRITISGGVSEYQGTSIDQMIITADNNLYKAKNCGRNRIVK